MPPVAALLPAVPAPVSMIATPAPMIAAPVAPVKPPVAAIPAPIHLRVESSIPLVMPDQGRHRRGRPILGGSGAGCSSEQQGRRGGEENALHTRQHEDRSLCHECPAKPIGRGLQPSRMTIKPPSKLTPESKNQTSLPKHSRPALAALSPPPQRRHNPISTQGEEICPIRSSHLRQAACSYHTRCLVLAVFPIHIRTSCAILKSIADTQRMASGTLRHGGGKARSSAARSASSRARSSARR